jgi:8-oxo-dGTP pyrophosphatase MutT (NUDIX family)
MLKKSAVIVMHEQVTDSLILTRRTDHLREHPGEICFPGGRWESGDMDLWATALRELHEELGVAADRVELVKELEPEQTLGGSIIHPWLATISTLEPYALNNYEVAEVIMLPMHAVRTIGNYENMVINRAGESITTCQFTASSYFVWGATARIMKQLLVK